MRAGPRPAEAGSEAVQQRAQEQQRPPTTSPLKPAAAEVLRREGRPMTAGEICRTAIEWGLLSCTGRLPEASLASALQGDIKRHGRSSLFTRPQEGRFGLREWAGQTTPQPCHHPDQPGQTGNANANSVAPSRAAGFAPHGTVPCDFAGAGMPPSSVEPAQPAAQPTTAPKRAHPESSAAGKGPGRTKKARRSTGEQEDWSDSASLGLSDREQLDGSEDEGRLEPRQYSLRRGQVGRLQEAVETATAAAAAATAAAAAAGLSAAWTAPCLASGPSVAGVSAALPAPEPLDLPNLRPASAEGSKGQHSALHNRRPSSGGGASLLSPPLHLALQSPLPRPPMPGSGGSGNHGSLFSPCSGVPGLRSPLQAVPWLNSTPAMLRNLLSPNGPASPGSAAQQQRQQAASQAQRPSSCGSMLQAQVPAAPRGSAASTTAATAPAAPGTAGSVFMVPVGEGAALPGAAGTSALPPIPPLHLGSQQRYSVLPFAAGQTPLGEPGSLPALDLSLGGAGGTSGAGKQPGAVGVYVDAAGWQPLSGEAAASGNFEIVPTPAAGLAGGPAGSASTATAPGAVPAAAAGIVQRVREVQAKVRQVEAKWGPLSLKTGQAYFLMAHACMHPQAAALFRAEAEAALRRSQEILLHNSTGLAAGQEDEYQRLLKGIRSAASRAASGGRARGVAGAT